MKTGHVIAFLLLSIFLCFYGCTTIHEEWAKVDLEQNPRLYRQFLQSHPTGPYTDICQQRLVESDILAKWNGALWQDDTVGYVEFLEDFPESPYSALCLIRLNELRSTSEWDWLSSTDSLDLYLGFLFEYQLFTAGEKAVAAISLMMRDFCDWQSAIEKNSIKSYEEFLRDHPDSFFKDEAESRVVDLEVQEILSKDPPRMPTAERVEWVPNREFTVVNIHNNTKYDLVVRYSGTESFKVTLSPMEKGSIEVANGTYNVTASVTATDVQNYAGREDCDGSNCQIEYYIVDAFSYYKPSNEPLQYFEQWKVKREYKSKR